MPEQVTTPRELLATCLRQMLWIERKLAYDVLPQLRDRVRTPDLRAGFDRHLLETKSHAATMRDLLGDLHTSVEPEESPALEGLLAQHERWAGRVAADDRLLGDLVHGMAALATEHLELGAYESIVSLAEALGEDEVGIRLREVLEQEDVAREQVESALAKLLAEKVESPRL